MTTNGTRDAAIEAPTPRRKHMGEGRIFEVLEDVARALEAAEFGELAHNYGAVHQEMRRLFGASGVPLEQRDRVVLPVGLVDQLVASAELLAALGTLAECGEVPSTRQLQRQGLAAAGASRRATGALRALTGQALPAWRPRLRIRAEETVENPVQGRWRVTVHTPDPAVAHQAYQRFGELVRGEGAALTLRDPEGSLTGSQTLGGDRQRAMTEGKLVGTAEWGAGERRSSEAS